MLTIPTLYISAHYNIDIIYYICAHYIPTLHNIIYMCSLYHCLVAQTTAHYNIILLCAERYIVLWMFLVSSMTPSIISTLPIIDLIDITAAEYHRSIIIVIYIGASSRSTTPWCRILAHIQNRSQPTYNTNRLYQ